MSEGSAHPTDHPLDPPLPFDMKPRLDRATADVSLRQAVQQNTMRKHYEQLELRERVFGKNQDAVRRLGAQIKQHTLDHLDVYLDRFIDQATAAGAIVHYAADARQANEIGLAIAQTNNCRLCVKSKSMVTEETQLVPALEAVGIETLETDLGEFILQLDHDAPSHIVAPMIHKDRASVGRAFERELGADYCDDPAKLTLIAREHMRQKYRAADLGISGANFLVADTGSLVVCTNEGNADLAMGVPRIHIAFVGIEKLVPDMNGLSVLLKLLARASTAQPLTVYTTIITGPRRAEEHDGPQQLHIVMLDNGRTEILRPATRELLRCIRCGACLNACPVYRSAGGGHAYGAVYSGPIGAAITPLLKGVHNYPDLPRASSLCGACLDACPVKIDIPHQLVQLRNELVKQRITSRRQRLLMRLWAASLKHPVLYRCSNAMQRMILRLRGHRPPGHPDRFSDRKWIHRLRGGLSGWTDHRDFPTPTSRSFRSWWRTSRRENRS